MPQHGRPDTGPRERHLNRFSDTCLGADRHEHQAIAKILRFIDIVRDHHDDAPAALPAGAPGARFVRAGVEAGAPSARFVRAGVAVAL